MKYNLVLSGGGVRSYAHIGVYKYCFENNIEFNEIVSVSGGSIIAPFIFLRINPDKLIKLFKRTKIHRMLFPFWFGPDKFEFLFFQPSTYKVGEWVEKIIIELYGNDSLENILSSNKLHIMATRNPLCGTKLMPVDMLTITDLKNSIAASSSISGIFKDHKVNACSYIDGGHWNNCPIFFNFNDDSYPLITSNLGYAGLVEKEGGRISKIINGLEIMSYARVQEDIERWNFEMNCNKRGELTVINPAAWNVHSLDFNLKDFQIDTLIEAGYSEAKKTLENKSLLV
jgi:predicted acylesterase/phospholipase RssA